MESAPKRRKLGHLSKMSPHSGRILQQQHAKTTAKLLPGPGANPSESSSGINLDVDSHMFDMVVTIEIAGPAAPDSPLPSGRDRELYKVLTKALGNRVQLVHIQPGPLRSPAPDSAPLDTQDRPLKVGLMFEDSLMSRPMEYGPAAEDKKEAERFRKFWGTRAELRRFKNGNIQECVQWSGKTAAAICEEIVRYTLARHLSISHEHLTFTGIDFSSVVPMTQADKPGFDAARAAFQKLESSIRSLDGLVLQVRTVSPVAPSLRYSSVDVPILGLHRAVAAPMDVNLTFEASGKWPENLVAIQHAKIELLLDLGTRLSELGEGITPHLGRENVDVVTANLANISYLDLVYASGPRWRLRILCDMEESLLESQVKNKTLAAAARLEAEDCLDSFRWLSAQLPRHSQMISTWCTRFPSLSPTIRLVKHWFNRHMLSGHFSEELIELFVLHAFLRPGRWKVPASGWTGFFRTLHLLSRWNWKEEPLIVGAAKEDEDGSGFPDAQQTAVFHRLRLWRKQDPNMCRVVMVVATPHDHTGLAYTRKRPSNIIAARLTRLAAAAVTAVQDEGAAARAAAPEKLFRPSLRDYDVLIHLSPAAIKTIMREVANDIGAGHSNSHFKNLHDQVVRATLPLARHPVTVLLEDLERTYADSLLFFHDCSEHNVIAALWHPRLSNQRFRVGLPYNMKASRRAGEEGEGGEGGGECDGDEVELNKRAVLLEIARLGGDMVKKIEMVT